MNKKVKALYKLFNRYKDNPQIIITDSSTSVLYYNKVVNYYDLENSLFRYSEEALIIFV